MKSLQELQAAVDRTATFSALVKHVMLAKDQGPTTAAAMAAADPRCPRAVAELLQKAAVSAGHTGDPDWAAANLAGIQASFVESLSRVSPFDRMLSDGMRKVPLRQRIVSMTSTPTGANPGEGAAKPISRMALGGAGIAPRKSSVIAAITEDVLRDGGAAIENFLMAELRRALSRATNTAFLAELAAAASSSPSLPSVDFATDVQALLQLVDIGETSKLFLIAEPKPVAAVRFARALVGGGSGDITLLASDALPAGVALLVDADQVAAGAEAIAVDSARHASLLMDSAPTMSSGGIGSPDAPTGAQLVSLFQTNAVGLKAERYWGFSIVGTNAVAIVENVSSDWGSGS